MELRRTATQRKVVPAVQSNGVRPVAATQSTKNSDGVSYNPLSITE